jgi:glycosyltransferase involved in cell wall biosynthesis
VGPLLKKLKQLTDEFTLTNKITFIENIPQIEVYSYMKSSQLIVLPYSNEPFGLTILEAMACEKPIITGMTGGIPEFFKNGRNGLMVNPIKAPLLYEAILTLYANTEKMEFFKLNNKTDVTNFSWEKVTELYLDMFKKILSVL